MPLRTLSYPVPLDLVRGPLAERSEGPGSMAADSARLRGSEVAYRCGAASSL